MYVNQEKTNLLFRRCYNLNWKLSNAWTWDIIMYMYVHMYCVGLNRNNFQLFMFPFTCTTVYFQIWLSNKYVFITWIKRDTLMICFFFIFYSFEITKRKYGIIKHFMHTAQQAFDLIWAKYKFIITIYA